MNTQNVNTAAAESTETRFNGDKILRLDSGGLSVNSTDRHLTVFR